MVTYVYELHGEEVKVKKIEHKEPTTGGLMWVTPVSATNMQSGGSRSKPLSSGVLVAGDFLSRVFTSRDAPRAPTSNQRSLIQL